MSNFHSALVVAGCLGLAWPAAAAQDQTPSPGLTFDAARLMDADRDGRITREEFLMESADEDLFVQLDTNADGVLDIEEQRFGIRVPVRATR